MNADLGYCTKRKALGLVSQLWDPLGLMAPVSIQFRIDLQSLWAAGFQWDELLPPEEKSKWVKNLENMNALLGTHLKTVPKTRNSHWKSTTLWVLRCGRIRIWRHSLPSMGTGRWQVYLQIRCSKGLGCATEKEDHTKTRIDGLLGAE